MNLVVGLLLAVGVATTTPSAPLEKTPPAPLAVDRTPVYLQTDAQDPIGAIYVAKLRAALEGSSEARGRICFSRSFQNRSYAFASRKHQDDY